MALRLMVYDRNPSAGRLLVLSWRLGAWLYFLLGRIDDWFGADSWEAALAWLSTHRAPELIGEVQYWGHGRAGEALIGQTKLDALALEAEHPLHAQLVTVRARLSPGVGLWWFRTCSTYGTTRGQAFAQQWTDFLGCRTAGHTFVIGPWQSGLHSLRPGETPAWPVTEGNQEGVSLWSKPGAPNTITCFHGAVPAGF